MVNELEKMLIAIIDDDESLRTTLVDFVELLGYVARGFASGEEFIASELDGLCNCIITDIYLPGMSGLELTRLLHSRRSSIPVIVITARFDPGIESTAAAHGALCLLRKPFDGDVLADCLEKALEV